MKTIPILFSTEMVQAILEGRKTQTRRVVKWQPRCTNASWVQRGIQWFFPNAAPEGSIKCPFGQPGDVLWVRESWRKYFPVDENGYMNINKEIIQYRADNPEEVRCVDGDGFQEWNKDGSEKYIGWNPSIHMPKAACRLFLKITNIRVERLQDISMDDVVAEGLNWAAVIDDDFPGIPLRGWKDFAGGDYFVTGDGSLPPEVRSYKSLWQKINGADSWAANPWVWVVEFERCEKPENF